MEILKIDNEALLKELEKAQFKMTLAQDTLVDAQMAYDEAQDIIEDIVFAINGSIEDEEDN
jgi:hypothetical protein